MNTEEKKRLVYRRQYLLTQDRIKPPFQYHEFEIGMGYVLYAHTDLKVTSFEKDNNAIFLLGDMFDYRFPEKGNHEILEDLYDQQIIHLIRKHEKYSGRYVVIFRLNNQVILFTDIISSRKVFYSVIQKKPIFASQPHLLAEVLGLKKTKDKSLLDFYNSEVFKKLSNANIGDYTCYDEIRQLRVNHYYDVSNQKMVRFWPYRNIEKRPIDLVAQECSSIIKGYCESLVNRYKRLMLPVTGGKDSRTLFAAIKDKDPEIYYYLNDDIATESADFKIAEELLAEQGKEFHMEAQPEMIDPDFKEIYFRNNPDASEMYLPLIYNYYLKFGNYVNLPGNIASAGMEYYKFAGNDVTAHQLSILNWVQDFPFADAYYEKWLADARPLCSEYRINLLSLFYWEERMANWGTQVQTDKDIAQEDFNLLNSYDFVSRYLSVQARYIMPPGYKLHQKIIANICKECMKQPFNKPEYMVLKTIIQKLGLLQLVYQTRFKLKAR
jgi:hypothetical protein